MAHYRTTPTYEQPFMVKDSMATSWWRWFQDTDLGVPSSGEVPITPVASPYIYTAPQKGNLIVSGGTVTAILFSRSGTFYLTGQTSGMFNICANDQVKIVYSSPPTLTFAPD